METKIEKIGGKNKLTVQYKGQVFIVQCDSEDVNYFKNNIDVMIKRFKDDLLGQKDKTSESNAILPDVSGCEPDLIRIYRVECLTEDGDIEVNGHFKDKKLAELMKAEHDKNKRNIKYGIKQNIVEIILEG